MASAAGHYGELAASQNGRLNSFPKNAQTMFQGKDPKPPLLASIDPVRVPLKPSAARRGVETSRWRHTAINA